MFNGKWKEAEGLVEKLAEIYTWNIFNGKWKEAKGLVEKLAEIYKDLLRKMTGR